MPLAHIVDLARLAASLGASDLFLAEDAPARLKVNGLMQEATLREVTREDLAEFWRSCGANPDAATDVDTAWRLPGGLRFRVNLHRHLGRLGAVLRRIRTQVPTLESLGLPEALLQQWLTRRTGLILVTGPTGCGKSTTIASCLEWINVTRSAHIVTIEDPVEYIFEDRVSFFTQREVGMDTESFHAGLRRALRQAPDVIFVGEIRDSATAVTALQAAETGHLVLSTLHSPNVAETIDRLVHLMPANERDSIAGLLAQQTIGILTQRLLPTPDEKGLTLVCEHLEISGAARDWMRALDVPALVDLMRRGDNPANRSFQEALVQACREGRVSREVAIANAPNAHEFARSLRGIS